MARFPSPVNHGLRCLNMRMLALAVCITLFHALLPAQCTTLTIATSYNVAMDPSTYVSSLYISGLMAPLRAASGNGVSYIASTSSLSNTMAPKTNSLVQTMASEGAVAVFGFAGTFMFAYIMHWKFDNPQKIPIFGPFAETADLASGGYYITGPYAEYKPWILWTIPLDGAQSLALLYYLASRPFFPVNQVALIQNSETGGPVYYGVGRTAGLLFALEMPKFGVTQYTTANTVNAYSSIMQSKPGIVYMFGQLMGGQGYVTGGENTVTAGWIQRAVSDTRLVAANSTVVTTFYIQYAMLKEYQSQRSSGKKMLPPENIISSAPTPGVDAAEYSVTQNFHTEVTSFSGCGNNACKNYVLAGWVSATALTHAISMYGGTSAITCKSLFSNLQPAQSSFLVSDLFIGSFGPDSTTCSAVAQSQGAVCHCNQAGMNVFFTRFGIVGSQVDVVTIPGAVFQYAKGKCASVIPPGDIIPVIMPYTDLVTFSVAKRLVGLSPTDNAMMSDMCNAVSAVSTVFSNRVLYRHLAPNGYTVGCISTTLATASSAVTSHMSSYVTTAMSGVMPDAMVDSIPTPSTFVLDFMPQTTQPQVMRSNLVYLFPTLDQELYVLASYLHDVVTASSVVCGVVSKSSVSPSIVTLLSRSLMTYGMTVASGHFVQTSSALASSIPSACTHTFLVGVGDGDASGVASYLKSHTSAVVLLSFDDVTKYYSSLRTFVGGLSSSMTDRLVFATNVPSWTATPSNPTAASASAPLSTVTQFLQSVPDSLHTPAAVRAFIVAMMYDLLMSGSHDTDPNVQKLLYAAVTVHLDGMVFGPFSAECTSMEAPMSGGCVGNVGATAIAVWSYTRVVKPATPLLVSLAVPSMAHQYASGVPAAAVGEDMDDVNASSDTSMQAACVSWSDSSVVEVSSSSSSNTTTMTSPPVSLRPQSSSGETTSHTRFSISINDVLIFFYAAVVVVLVVIVVLLLWKYNVVHRVWECPRHLFAFFGGCWEPRLPSDDGQRQRSMDASRWVASSVVSRTIVVVEVDHWRPLWVHVPEVMRHVVEDYRRCVRGAVLRHGCVEVCAVGGVFVLVCPSAFSSVQLVKDIHAGLNAMSSELKAALVSAYLSFRAVGDGAEPQTLCVRVGVDTNGVGSDPIGPFLCSDGSVEVATRAAYRSGPWHSGLCVMTERTRSALTEEELTSVHLCLPSAGLHALHCGSENVVLELFVLVSDACAETTLSTSISSERRCDFALEMLSSGTETSVESVSTALCLTALRAFYHGLPSQRVEGLVKMHQWLGLPAVSLSAYADESGYVDALLACVCQRVAALLECRHGFLPGELRHRSVRGVSCVRMREEEGLGDNDANHARSNGKRSKRGRRRFSVHNSTRNVLRRFAYESGVAEL